MALYEDYQILDEICTKNFAAGVEDAASKKFFVQRSPKDANFHRAIFRNSRYKSA